MDYEPKKMYQSTGRIYIIKSKQTEDVYYGSTFKSLEEIFKKLNRDYKRYKKNLEEKGKHLSFEILKYDDVWIELVKEYQNITKHLLLDNLSDIIKENKCLNIKMKKGRTTDKIYRRF